MRTFPITGLSLLLLSVLLSGCVGIVNQHEFTEAAPQVMQQLPPPPSNIVTGSIYRDGQDIRLFEDRTARRVGDLLTVRLVERTQASKQASTVLDKESEVDIPNPVLFGQPVEIGAYTLENFAQGSRSADGGGESDQSNRLDGTLSAVVIGVYPNGNLAIRGEKMLTLNQGEEFVQLTGVVRPEDIAPDNSVLSTRVADARITYAGKGALADANAPGWLTRFFLSPLWPF